MILSDFHIHTTYCDGKSTAEEVVRAAIECGLKTIGFSGHGFTEFDDSYCMTREATEKYRASIGALKKTYQNDIRILCGVEQEYHAGKPIAEFDYVIGSCHYLLMEDGSFSPIDESAEILSACIRDGFGGDIYAAAESYFRCVGDVVEKTGADIIGHIDLISKFSEIGCPLDFTHPRYRRAYTDAIDRLIPYGKPFEINTGAISRGYRTIPYPAMPIMRYIASQGGAIIFSSDCHMADNIAFQFDVWEPVYRAFGTRVLECPI